MYSYPCLLVKWAACLLLNILYVIHTSRYLPSVVFIALLLWAEQMPETLITQNQT